MEYKGAMWERTCINTYSNRNTFEREIIWREKFSDDTYEEPIRINKFNTPKLDDLETAYFNVMTI